MMILLTGAGGKTGQTILSALHKRGAAVRAFVRREVAGVECVIGDMTNVSDWDHALVGCDKVYHICPNMHPDEVEIGRIALTKSRNHNISHFVYHSVLHPQTEKMPHHWNKMRVEEMLFESGIPFTILQPTAYIQNLRPQWERIVRDGTFTMPYPVETRISLVDLHDVAEVAAKVLTEKGHFGATYELVGTEPLSQMEVAERIGGVIGRKVTAQAMPLTQWQATATNLSEYALNTLSAMFRYYADHGLVGNRFVLQALLGRVPTSLETVIHRW